MYNSSNLSLQIFMKTCMIFPFSFSLFFFFNFQVDGCIHAPIEPSSAIPCLRSVRFVL